jgi:DNA-binding HxlR family transcriptional regulator
MKRHVFDCMEGCPVESTLQIISGKWKSVIIFKLMKHDVCRFGELQRLIPDCSKRMLALQLNELEDDNIINKTLIPVINEMAKWGEMYNSLKKQR